MAWESAYASDHIDLLLRLKEVVTGYPLVTMPVRSGNGDGIIHGIHTTEANTTIESWSVTCISDMVPATFSVTGSVSGVQDNATVGVPYSNTDLSFHILAGSVPFSVGDNFVFSTQTNPLIAAADTWTVERWVGTGAKPINYLVSSAYDGTSTYIAERAIDDNVGTYWVSDPAQGNGSWWQVQYDKPVDIRRLSISGYNADQSWAVNYSHRAPRDFSISYSDDGSNWTVDSSYTAQTSWQNQELRDFFLTGTGGAHKYWRLTITNVVSGTVACLPSLALYDENNAYNVGFYGDGYDTIIKGPGVANGDNIYVSIRSDAYVHNGPNWLVAGSVGYSSGLGTFNQPRNSSEGFSDVPRLALFDQPLAYWIIASGRRIMVFARFQGITTGCHLGYLLQYALPSQYPYPLLIAGSQSAGGANSWSYYGWQRQDGRHRLFMHPGTGGWFPNDTLDASSSACRLYTPYNTWKQASNIVNNTTWSNGHNSLVVWPYQTEEGGSATGYLAEQLDGKWPMSPVVFIDRQVQASYGEIDGVKHIPGVHAAESLITHEGDTWVILNNVHRVSDNEFFAVRLS